jgi:hypothetical protein
MPDIYTLVAKIRALPKRRIAEVEDFVDFLTLRRSSRTVKPPITLWERMSAIEAANKARHGDQRD